MKELVGVYELCRYCANFFESEENEAGSCSYHPKLPVNIGNTGPRGDYAELWSFPCCGRTVKADIVESRDAAPSQVPGCSVGRHVVETGWNVFLSYARSDEAKAVTLENEMRRRGHRAWRDRSDLVPGAPWADTIDRAIADADYVVLLLTPRSAESVQVLREVTLALAQGKNLVPVLFEDCAIPAVIRHINCVDWRSVEFDSVYFATKGFDQLRTALIFGSAGGPWVQTRRTGAAAEVAGRSQVPAAPRHRVLLRDSDGDVVGEIRPRKSYPWSPGHLLCVDGIVYVVVDVLAHSPTSVEVRVERARVPDGVSRAGSGGR